MAISHAGHNHPATPAGRRACRTGNTTPDLSQGRSPERAKAEARDRDERQARIRKSFEKPVRIQPRRAGARVSGAFSTCVQAALHVDAHGGRCACGWTANKEIAA